MREKLASVFLAAGLALATVGTASCQRQETPPPPTPIAASGEPRPSGIEAEIQRRVQATVTTQQETTFKTTQPELELFEASSFEFKYPKGWIKEEKSHLPISFIDPKSAKDNPTKITFFISGNPFGSSADIDTLLEDIERREGMSLSRSNYKGPPPKAKQIPPVDRKPAYRISVERVPDPEGKPEYDLNTFIIFSAEEIVYFNLFTDPSVTDKIKPLFETVVRTFKERPVQRVEVPPKAPPPRAEAQKPSVAPAAPRAEAPRQERPKSPEEQILEQAKTETLNTWFQLLNSPQKVNTTSLQIKILNFDLWQRYIQDITATNRHPTEMPMAVRWFATSFLEIEGALSGSKYLGELQINNLQLQDRSRPLSVADRANGLTWDGNIIISFIRRYHALYAQTHGTYGAGWTRDKTAFNKWLSSQTEDSSLPTFSPWENEYWLLNLRMRNGQWERVLKQREGRVDGPAMLNGMVLPVDALSYLDPPRCRGNCKTIKVDMP